MPAFNSLRLRYRLCKLGAATTLLFVAAMHLVEWYWTWSGAIVLIAASYVAEACFEILRPEHIPPQALI
jgi:hypothetical protein